MTKNKSFSTRLRTFIALFLVLGLWSCGLKELTDFDNVQVKGAPEMVLPLAYGNVEMQSVINLMGEDSLIGKNTDNDLVVSYSENDIFKYAVKDLIEFESSLDLGSFDFDLEGVTLDFDFSHAITLGDLLEEMSGDIQELKDADGKEQSFPAYTYEPSTPTEFEVEASDEFESVTFSGGQLRIEFTNELPVFGVFMRAELYDIANNNVISALDFGFAERYPGYDIYYSEDYFDGEKFGLPGSIATANGSPGSATEIHTIDLAGLTMSNQLGVRLSYFYTDGSGGIQPVINFEDGLSFSMQLIDAEIESGRFKVPEQTIEGEQQKLDNIKISDDINLHKATLNSGTLNVSMNKTLPITGNIVLDFPSITRNGNVLSASNNFSAADQSNFSIDLANTEIDFSENAGNIFNTLFYGYSVVVNPTDDYVDFGANESFNFSISISNLDIKSAEGDFGQMEVALDEDEFNLSLDFFDLLDGNLTLLNPTIKLIIENTLSVPVEASLDLTGYNGDASAALGAPAFIVPYPDYPAQTSITGEVVFDNSNSNIVDFFALPPTDKITYGGQILMNPDGPPSNDNLNYVDMNGEIGFSLEVEIPLQFTTESIAVTDTLSFDGGTLDMVKSGELLLHAENGLPFGVDLQLSFVDSLTYETKGAVVQTMLLEAAQVDAEGNVTAPSSSNSSINLSAANIPAYRDASAIIFTATIASPGDGSQPAKLNSTNEIYLNVGLKAGIDLGGISGNKE
ncbi:translocation/assembly module TamB domain-containing protein [Roseimarinus sediminis]|uniref:hypothetical protein n=1 Tax=Roseimarinus sediminis TaxID=1610899 RepID=UPI003D24EA7A